MASPTPPELEATLHAERIRAVYGRGVLPMLTNVVNAALLVAVVYAESPRGVALGWLAVMALLTAARIALVLAWRRAQPQAPEQVRPWGARYLISSAANGIAWGGGALLLYPPESPATQGLILIVLAGMTAGTSSTTSGYLQAFQCFAAPALLPVALRLALAADLWHGAVAGMVLLFAGMMAALARGSARAFADGARLRFANAQLVAELSAAQKELERRVEQRSSQLQASLARQRGSEEELRRYRALVDQSGAGILVIAERTLEVVDCNETAASMIGRSTEALRGAKLPELDVAGVFESERGCRSFFDELGTDEPRVFEDVRANPDGIARAIEVSASRRELDGHALVLLVLRDVSGRKAFEARLAQAGLLASVGGLAAGVAHEVNNPLAYILSNLGFLRETLAGEAPLSDDARRELVSVAEESLEGAEKVRKVVGDLGALARQVPDTPELVDVRPVLQACLSLAEGAVRQRARLVEELGDVPMVKGNRARLSQVFLNLLVNAAQAIPEGTPDQHEVRVVMRWAGLGNPVVVEVADTGVGISEEERERIFQPFFTTKGQGRGVGLGLAVCHSLVTGMGGSIRFESRPGVGTRFFVSLPPVERPFTVK